jgi:hypothetical protein
MKKKKKNMAIIHSYVSGIFGLWNGAKPYGKGFCGEISVYGRFWGIFISPPRRDCKNKIMFPFYATL